MKKLGIIQVRGLGDCVIVLPIAKWYHDLGYEVFFAIDDRFYEQFQAAAPYCTFIPVPFSSFNPQHGILNEYWYELPHLLLREQGCKEILSFPQHECLILNRPNLDPIVRERLMSRLTGTAERRMWETHAYKHLKADEFRYSIANVPLKEKWNLFLQRDTEREQALYTKLVDPSKQQMVCHLEGSNFSVDVQSIPYDPATTQVISITREHTPNLFDWLLLLEKAESIVLIDSLYFNIVEQLNFANTKKYFIRRSPRESNPVMGNLWEFVKIEIPDHTTLY